MPSGLPATVALLLALAPSVDATASGSVTTNGSEADLSLSKRKDRRWIERWAPERNLVELGIFGGLLVPPLDHELFRPKIDRVDQGFLTLRRVAPVVGFRVGYFPLRYFGIEAEGAFVPTAVDSTDQTALIYGARGSLVAQLPYTITPFVSVGAGALGLTSEEAALGNDIDPALHIGLGGKLYVSRRFHVRLDVRDYLTPRRGVGGGATNWIEATLGIGLTLGRRKDIDHPRPEPPSKPPPIADTDGDGWFDDDDACPKESGIEPDGCPPPPDGDEDGIVDTEDRCPDVPGIEPDGCPDLDPDEDGILTSNDACPDEPEVHNGFEDSDGCPDEVPEEIARFEGTLEGVTFDLNSAKLTKQSEKTLDAAVAVLEKYPEIKVEISGHTDSSGKREHNLTLSRERADAVVKYLADHGIAGARMQTRGAGPDEPIDTNKTKQGRANNRRIEFRVLD